MEVMEEMEIHLILMELSWKDGHQSTMKVFEKRNKDAHQTTMEVQQPINKEANVEISFLLNENDKCTDQKSEKEEGIVKEMGRF